MNKKDLGQFETPDFKIGSRAEADHILKQIISQQPELKGKIQVMATDELEEVL